jgi:hypothetical protein
VSVPTSGENGRTEPLATIAARCVVAGARRCERTLDVRFDGLDAAVEHPADLLVRESLRGEQSDRELAV